MSVYDNRRKKCRRHTEAIEDESKEEPEKLREISIELKQEDISLLFCGLKKASTSAIA